MIFCPNECIGVGSGKGEGWPAARSMRDTQHARGLTLPALRELLQNFSEGKLPQLAHRLPSRFKFECNSDVF